VPIAAATGTLAFLGLSAAVRTRKSTNASRSSTAERHMGRARQASPVPPAYDVRVAGSDLPIVAPTLWSAAQYVGLAWYTLLKMSLSTRLFNKYAYVAMLFVLRYVIKDPTSTESKPSYRVGQRHRVP
jgi:uncharacterized membrane protein